jgi:hypothetical protein
LTLLQGARSENILHGSSTDEQRSSSGKDRQPGGLFSIYEMGSKKCSRSITGIIIPAAPAECSWCSSLANRTSRTQPAAARRAFCFPNNQHNVNYAKLNSLIPAVVQDAETSEVPMVGFMNEQALAATRRVGFATFFSRTRGALWTKR